MGKVNLEVEKTTEVTAQAFVTARRRALPLDAFPGTLPTTLADAYAVQERCLALTSRPVAGWKVAMIHPDLRASLGADRLAGPIFADAIHDRPDGGSVLAPVFVGGFAALEAEFVARFARSPEAGADGFTVAGILAALASLHAGAEIASSPLATLNQIGPLAVVCDHGNNAGAVVGPELTGWRDTPPERLTSRMVIDGKTVGEGTAAGVPGSPIAALVFLADHLAARGRRLNPGDIVLTGATTGVHPVVPGVQGRILFSGAADCTIDVTAAVATAL
ncbi:MAG: 2-keto-4-pentenoate hydratase [Azospirillaceae bacterium]|nr:2-keto-4-pentenoate hydratase [Azospirillaceae bacterium]